MSQQWRCEGGHAVHEPRKFEGRRFTEACGSLEVPPPQKGRSYLLLHLTVCKVQTGETTCVIRFPGHARQKLLGCKDPLLDTMPCI
eukprot:1158392-Pelagomonas_calceolata.AAC.4